MIEDLGRYVDGTLQSDVHDRDVEFKRVPNSGRALPDGWACDFDVLFLGQRTRVTVSITEANP
jgi:hypothetical protein